MTIRPMLAIPALLLAFAVSAAGPKPVDAPTAPKTIRIVAAEVIEEGEPGDRQWTFTLISAESGACYAIAPPGGEGVTAGDSYIIVAATDVDEAIRTKLAVDRPNCAIVDVVARAVKR
jgi:hypothetical protein